MRLITSASIEEHIYRVSDEKRKFADSSITGMLLQGGRSGGGEGSKYPAMFYHSGGTDGLITGAGRSKDYRLST